MNEAIRGFLLLPLWLRMAVLLFLLFVVFWLLLGKPVIIRLLSLIPFVLRKLFQGLYFVVQFLFSSLHRAFPSAFFHDLENGLSRTGAKIDARLEQWYRAWHFPKRTHFLLAMGVYAALLILLGFLPQVINSPNSLLAAGERWYLTQENSWVTFLEARGFYISEEKWFQESMILRVGSSSYLQKGKLLSGDGKPIIQNEKLYLPVRDMAMLFDGTVKWDKKTKSILLEIVDNGLVLDTATETVRLQQNAEPLDGTLLVLDESTYLEARPVLEALGYNIHWYSKYQIATVNEWRKDSINASILERIEKQLAD